MFSIFTFSLFDTCLHLNFSWSSVLLLTTFSVNSYSNYFLVSSGPSCLRLLFSLLPNWKCRSLEQICAVRRHDKFSILHRSTDKTKLESHLILVGKLSLSCPLHFLSFGYCYDKTIASLWNTSSYKGITNLTCQGHLLANLIQILCSCRFSPVSILHRPTDKSKLQSHLILVSTLSLSCPLHFLFFFGYCYDKTTASPSTSYLDSSQTLWYFVIIFPLGSSLSDLCSVITHHQKMVQRSVTNSYSCSCFGDCTILSLFSIFLFYVLPAVQSPHVRINFFF
jgi:hypothetical protein